MKESPFFDLKDFDQFFDELVTGRLGMNAQHAFFFAHGAHSGQVRKYTNQPYINHPLTVSFLVWSVVKDYNMLAAAILHDVVEDCETNVDDLRHLFNDDIADMVDGLSDVSKPSDGNRAARKALDRAHIADQCPRTKTIKLADLIDNSSSIAEHDPNFAAVYMKEKRQLLEVLKEGNKNLYWEAKRIVGEYFAEAGTVLP